MGEQAEKSKGKFSIDNFQSKQKTKLEKKNIFPPNLSFHDWKVDDFSYRNTSLNSRLILDTEIFAIF